MLCHSNKLRAYMPARALSLSTLRIVHSGIVNRTDFRSRDVKARYGGIRYSFPGYYATLRNVQHSPPRLEWIQQLTYGSSTPDTPRLNVALISILSSSPPFEALPFGFSFSLLDSICGSTGREKNSCVSWSFVGSLKCRRCVEIVAILCPVLLS